MGSSCFPSFRRFSSLFIAVSAPVAVGSFSVPCAAAVVVNEVYYDHPGTDTGHEFVEVYNDADTAATLDGVTLEFHNGSGEGWSLLWSGSVLDTVPARGVFTVGAALVVPVPDAVTSLSLQNGPDAVALFRGGVVLDAVGYGGLDDERYAEGPGAAAVPAGRSIARVPDGRDTGNNAADFTAAAPTPGRTNVARHDASLVLSSDTRARDVDDDGVLAVDLVVVNAGTEAIAAGAVTVGVRDSSAAGVAALADRTNTGMVAAGAVETLSVPFSLDVGYHWLSFTARHALDERAHNDALLVLRRVGTPPLLVSEVLSSPPSGCPQFVEVYNAGGVPVAIGGWGLRDRSHDPVPVAPDGAMLDAGGFAVFTPDSSALTARFPIAPGVVLGVLGTWPAVNRTGGEVADSVIVVDALGLRVDAVAVPGVPTAAAGRSLERVDLYRGGAGVTWVLSREALGASPGRAGERVLLSPPPVGAVVVSPNPFVPGDGVMTVAVDAPGAGRVVVSVFDTRGRRIAAVGMAAAFPAVLVWNGRDDSGREVAPGLYVLACEIVTGGSTRVVKEVIGCGRR